MLRLRVFAAAAVAASLLGGTPAFAASSYFTFVPARFRTLELTASSRALGEICLSRDQMPDGTVCNPAYLPDVRDSTLVARLYLGNGYSALTTANDFINKPLSKETMQALFSGDNVVAVEGNVGLNFTTGGLSAEFAPYRVQYVSELHNPNFPVIDLHAAIERSFVIAGGIPGGILDPNLREFRFGTKARILERKFVHGEFSFAQAGTDDPRDYLPSKKQTAFLLDPSIAWVGEKRPWKPRVSLGTKNVGFSSPSYDEYPNDVDLEAGVGVEPPVRFGRVRIGLDLVDLFRAPTFEDRLRLGASYQVGLLETMIGANASVFTFGLMFGLNFLQTAVVYEFFRDDLDGGGAETRLSTELSIRL
ncbi:MAG: hypothetical protein JST04_11685 [Bdellovibrionales bacterium]|nr:hypothetical protein [Bdellovibrionales bacterium]